ncbi:LCP family protein [Acidaminococcus massiliensis]|uniref:LCP family protein n=1 Tax=Acidaminococcus massiliensis TaxID=1852375 RepID=UPI00266CFA37|nr:LCP family protein [Acidaminococcus massiliensis]
MLAKYKVLIAGITAFLVAVAGFFLLRPEKPESPAQVAQLHGKRNIMVLGVDRRSGDTGRSDTLFVTMLDTSRNQAALLSVPRDTLVSIPGHGWDKVNHAYAYGGHDLSRKTLENFLGIQINNYVLVDFQGFIKLVDAIGGVDIDVEKPMQYADPYDGENGLVINLQPGRQHMDGTTAIQYVRYRDEEGDIGRVDRQQKFMKAVFAKLRSTSLLTRAPEIARTLYQSIETDLSVTDLASLLVTFAKNVSGTSQLETAMVQGSPAYLDDISYWIPNMMALRQQVAQFQGVQPGESYKLAAQIAKKKYDALLGTNSVAGNGEKRQIQVRSQELKKAVEQSRKMDREKGGPGNPGQNGMGIQSPGSSKSLPAPRKKALRASIVNCSGNPQAGSLAAGDARAVGFTVVSVTTGSPMERTQVLINAGSREAEERAANLPFDYLLLQGAVSPGSGDAVIYVGRDYGK